MFRIINLEDIGEVENMKKIKIGILGMGTVAKGFYDTYLLNKDVIDKKMNAEIAIEKILVKDVEKNRNMDIQKDKFVNDFSKFDLQNIDIVIELIGGIDPAFDYIIKALGNKCHVVTANKELIAKKGVELFKKAKENKVLLRYEASVGGGIPIINTLNDSLSSNKINSLMGILNGTTNYILSKMTKEKLEFDEALKQAQDLGFAEADPSADVDGYDASYKLAIISRNVFGVLVNPDEILKQGIRNISIEDIEYGIELGYKIKLLAIGKKENGHIELSVQPTLISKDHPIAAVNNEYNALFVEGNSVGEIMLYGKGAGAMPTGSAVLSDLIDIVVKGKEYIKVNDFENIKINNIGESPYYVRLEVLDKPGVFGSVAMTFGEYNISLDSVVQRARGDMYAPIIFITHEIDRKSLNNALDEIKAMEFVKDVKSIIKVIK